MKEDIEIDMKDIENALNDAADRLGLTGEDRVQFLQAGSYFCKLAYFSAFLKAHEEAEEE